MEAETEPKRRAKADPSVRKVNFVFLASFAAALVFVLYRLPSQLGSLQRMSSCPSNMKQIGTSLHLYAEAHDQRLPTAEWADAVYPYAKNWDLYTCDKVAEQGGKWGYAFHWKALGVNLASVGDPSKGVMLFETDALGKGVVANLAAIGTPRHGDRVVVGRLDTSTRTMPPEEAMLLEK